MNVALVRTGDMIPAVRTDTRLAGGYWSDGRARNLCARIGKVVKFQH